MRTRKKILSSLEQAYREEFGRADECGDERRMTELDFEFQRDQVLLEVLLDLRDAIGASEDEEPKGKTLLEKAQAIKQLTKLRPL
jgi:hypothetical protein